ncbi:MULTISPECIES: hypothetical protein [Herbaspirillum]|jgi:hypothetical protein|uniref:hypothetical protein n=1 Tax=Herbaspirillum TaxID=963 RepID=UPI0002E4024A|nr:MULTISPECIES: hypothetical protein [Herbaspirillum]
MISTETIATFELRIHEEELRRDAWRAAGNLEKYLEACGTVDCLERQLELRFQKP